MENTKIQYIADIIGDDYKKWRNEFVILDAGTGSGKTHFVLNVLSKYARENGKTMLYLCNRKKLRKEIQDRVYKLTQSKITIITYQTLQQWISKGEVIPQYDYIISDEAHYMTSDSFNEYTDLSYHYLMKQKNNVVVFMSATAKPFFQMLLEKKRVKPSRYFVLKKDYSYVNKVYFYKAKALTTIIDGILEQHPEDKIMVFCNSSERMLEMHEIYKDNANYFCSEESKKLFQIRESDCIKHITDGRITFERPILFTTKVLDNGIDLKDTAIKHIFTEIFDLDSMVQSLGRKRSLDLKSDTCNFYIKNYSKQGILCFNYQVQSQLEPLELLKKDEQSFNMRYGKDRKELKNNKIFYMNFGVKGNANNKTRTNGDIRINNMMYTKYRLDKRAIAKMLTIGYPTVVCDMLGKDLSERVEELDITPVEKDLFLEYLESIKGKFLFKDDQDELKNEFVKIGLRDRTMGIHTLNGKLKDKEYPYEIKNEDSQRDFRRIVNGIANPNRGKRYWLLCDLETDSK